MRSRQLSGADESARDCGSQNAARSILAVDELRLEVRTSLRRRTLGLTVDRCGELVLSAPAGVHDRTLRDFVREKKLWIYTKLAQKNFLRASAVAKEFVTGEGFSYLGRSYRLALVDFQDRPLKLDGGRFLMPRSEAIRGPSHLLHWYVEHAGTWLRRRVGLWKQSLGVAPTSVRVLDLGHRWGSCGKTGNLNFHWAVILLPASVVDYVVVHELLHLREPNHTPQFWLRVERALPDFERRKTWLREYGAAYFLPKPLHSSSG